MKTEKSPSLSAKSVRKKTAKNKKIDVSAPHGTPGVRWTKTCANIKIFFHCFFLLIHLHDELLPKRGDSSYPIYNVTLILSHFWMQVETAVSKIFKKISLVLKFRVTIFPFLSPLCILFAFTRSVCDFANKPITSKNSDLHKGKLTWTFFAYFFCFVFTEFG